MIEINNLNAQQSDPGENLRPIYTCEILTAETMESNVDELMLLYLVMNANPVQGEVRNGSYTSWAEGAVNDKGEKLALWQILGEPEERVVTMAELKRYLSGRSLEQYVNELNAASPENRLYLIYDREFFTGYFDRHEASQGTIVIPIVMRDSNMNIVGAYYGWETTLEKLINLQRNAWELALDNDSSLVDKYIDDLRTSFKYMGNISFFFLDQMGIIPDIARGKTPLLTLGIAMGNALTKCDLWERSPLCIAWTRPESSIIGPLALYGFNKISTEDSKIVTVYVSTQKYAADLVSGRIPTDNNTNLFV